MADETVEIDIKVKNDILPTIAELKELKRQLKETTDPEEFARLQRQIEDTTESINAAKVGAGNFFDVLGKLPGPIGFIGGQAAGLISSLKQFGQIKFSNIAQSFTELKNDFVDIAKGFGNLTGITTIYTTLNTALARSFVAVGVGETAAAAGAKAFAAALSATGIGALVVGLGLLIAFKYSGFIYDNIAAIISLPFDRPTVTLPIGISFYTFQTISYTVDVYRGDVKAQRNPMNFLLFVSLYHQLVAGPIVRYKTIADEMKKYGISAEDLAKATGVKTEVVQAKIDAVTTPGHC